ncbi:rubrerythrin [Candidatus Dojkabacteria bacterium]|nr:rubrerythrin [Candidatus Dojkabacteria bacterium]
MISKYPIDLSGLSTEQRNLALLRIGIMAELDAINLYEQLAASTEDEKLKKVFLDVAREEKEHVGEFETLLLAGDQEQVEMMKEGKKEVEDIIKDK